MTGCFVNWSFVAASNMMPAWRHWRESYYRSTHFIVVVVVFSCILSSHPYNVRPLFLSAAEPKDGHVWVSVTNRGRFPLPNCTLRASVLPLEAPGQAIPPPGEQADLLSLDLGTLVCFSASERVVF